VLLAALVRSFSRAQAIFSANPSLFDGFAAEIARARRFEAG
jgi:hypothetical protein